MADEKFIDLDDERIEIESKEYYWSHTRPDEPGTYGFWPANSNELHILEVTDALRVRSTLDGFNGVSVVDLSGQWLYGLRDKYDA